jgi:hypothetical protein|tara:strand:- start:494 stop:625 length:132 start_codon:yes stop_codon:yes gene_type:complete
MFDPVTIKFREGERERESKKERKKEKTKKEVVCQMTRSNTKNV